MGIDATWKEGYQKPLRMDERVVKLVDEKWNKIFNGQLTMNNGHDKWLKLIEN